MISKVCLRRMVFSLVVAAAGAFYAPVPFAVGRSAGTPSAQAGSASQVALDYEFFRTRVQPIFLKNRSEDHARCYTCHEISRHPGAFHLETLLPGASTWNEEQSRRNFQVVSQMAIPDAPKASFILLKPLAPEAGGNSYRLHDGGRQFASQDDPDWKTLAAWVSGEKGGR